jgi:hypothetical protein
MNMAGIEGLIDAANDVDERDHLYELAGLKFFRVPGNDEQVKMVVDSSVEVSDEEAKACRIAADLLHRHVLLMLDKINVLMDSDAVPDDDKSDLVSSAMALTEVNEGFLLTLNIISGDRSMESLVPRSVMRAVRSLHGDLNRPVSADVEVEI